MHLRAALRLSLPVALAACLLGCPPEATTQPAQQSGDATDPAPTGGDTAADPAPTPEAKPFDRASAKTPWVDAKVGDYCVYKMLKPKEMEIRCEVVEVGDATVTWKRSIGGEDRGQEVVDLADMEERYQEPTSLDAIEGTPEEKTIEIGGKELKVLIVKRSTSMGSTESWVTRDLPPFMIAAGGWAAVKSHKDGELMQELTDFGSAE
jgi:hypothetical protein